VALWVIKDRAEKMKVVALGGLCAYLKLYVHGDSPLNNAISLLAAPYCNNVPLMTGFGSFGSRLAPGADGIGAARYVSVSRSKAAQAFLYNDADLVPTEDNYDGSNQQPKHFLPIIPIVLLNGIAGIAVGWSTNILPHDLKDLIAATKAALNGEPIQRLIPSYAKYNLHIDSIGPNQWLLTGKVQMLDTSTVQITELPPGMSIENFRKRLIVMEDADEIVNYTDRSTDTIDITVKMKRGSIAKWQDPDAIEFFKLREKITERIVVIGWDGKSIRTYDSPEALVVDFVQWRLGWYTTRFAKLRTDSNYELIYWLALEILFEAKFPKRLGGFVNRTTLQDDVLATVARKKLTIDAAQLDRIVNLATYRWTQEFAAEVTAKIAALRKSIADYEAILASPGRLRQVYADELDQLRIAKV
jgi:DNA topoisomerase-2